MKLQKLWIEKFKNLENLSIDFTEHNGLTVVIGNNGSGKSNLLEAISYIFANRFIKLERIRDRKALFNYSLVYQLHYGAEITLKTDSRKLQFKSELKISEKEGLPKRVVAIYTGEENRLFKTCYAPVYFKYLSTLKTNFSARPEMLYLNKDFWAISLLCMVISDAEDDKNFIKNVLHINSVEAISFQIDNRKLGLFKEGPVKNLFNEIAIKNNFTLPEFKDLLNKVGNPNKSDLFLNLYIALVSKTRMFKWLNIKFNMGLDISSLSEGEKKQLLIKAAMECAGSEDTLFILDEPDASIHLSNKGSITKILKEYDNRATIVVSHSPTLTKTFDENQIIYLENGKQVDFKSKMEAVKTLCGEDAIYSLLFSRKNILIVEGKTDIEYIRKAISLLKDISNDYDRLDFDYFIAGGTDSDQYKILLNHIKDIEDRKIIILVDRDKSGREVARELLARDQNGIYVKSILDKLNANNVDIDIEPLAARNVYLVMMPNVYFGNNSDCLIEDMFGAEIINGLIKEVFDNHVSNKTSYRRIPKDIDGGIKDKCRKKLENADKASFSNFKILLDKLLEVVKR